METGKATKADFEATIEKMTANIEVENSKIEKLAADLVSATKDLNEAKGLPAAEHEDFVGEGKKNLTTWKALLTSLRRTFKSMELRCCR